MEAEEVKLREDCTVRACEILEASEVEFSNDNSEIECINIISDMLITESKYEADIENLKNHYELRIKILLEDIQVKAKKISHLEDYALRDRQLISNTSNENVQLQSLIIDAIAVIESCYPAVKEIREGILWQEQYQESHVLGKTDSELIKAAWESITQFKTKKIQL